jgi:hypothetical protein
MYRSGGKTRKKTEASTGNIELSEELAVEEAMDLF